MSSVFPASVCEVCMWAGATRPYAPQHGFEEGMSSVFPASVFEVCMWAGATRPYAPQIIKGADEFVRSR
jgi:hypothetical protein